MTEHIHITVEQSVQSIQMNRPEKKNALTMAMYETMVEALEQAENNKDIRVNVIQGCPGIFTSGNDLQDFMMNPPKGENAPVFRFLKIITTMKKPLIAAVDGVAVGIGTTMLHHCDLVYVSKNAKFQYPFVNLALVPEAASSLILKNLVGHQKASEIFYLGTMFGPKEATEFGFVNEVCETGDEVSQKVQQISQTLAQKAPEAVRITKQLLRSSTLDVQDRIKEEAAHFSQRLLSPEFAEAVQAFMQKRAPDFSRFE